VCDLDCTDIAWGHIALFYGDDFGGGGDCGVCGGDVIVVDSNSLLTASYVLCEPEWLFLYIFLVVYNIIH
jgi:hypothetical protein